MGKEDKKQKTKPVRRYKRAGLHFPTHIVRRELKAKMPTRRFQKEVEILITALLEHSVERLLVNAADKVTKGNYIDTQHLHSVLNDKDCETYRVFPTNIPGVN